MYFHKIIIDKIYWYLWKHKQRSLCIDYHEHIRDLNFNIIKLRTSNDNFEKYFNWRCLDLFSKYHRISFNINLPDNYYYSNKSLPPPISL